MRLIMKDIILLQQNMMERLSILEKKKKTKVKTLLFK